LRLEHFRFLQITEMLHVLVSTQFRAQSTLLLELLQHKDARRRSLRGSIQ
jgi:hypothetical protein